MFSAFQKYQCRCIYYINVYLRACHPIICRTNIASKKNGGVFCFETKCMYVIYLQPINMVNFLFTYVFLFFQFVTKQNGVNGQNGLPGAPAHSTQLETVYRQGRKLPNVVKR